MTITILVPVYGCEKYIEELAISLFSQTWPDLEYVFVDDCTPDKSIAILRGVIEKFPNRKSHVRIVCHTKNTGLGGARRTALSYVETDYFFIVDGDDVLPLDALETLAERMSQEDTDVVDGAYDVYCEGKYSSPHLASHNVGNKYLKSVLWSYHVQNNVCGKLYKNRVKDLVSDLFCEGIDYAEDYCAYARLARLISRSWTDKVVYHYRVEGQSFFTNQHSEKKLTSYLNAYRKIWEFYVSRSEVSVAVELAMINAYRIINNSSLSTRRISEIIGYKPRHISAKILNWIFCSRAPFVVKDLFYRSFRLICWLS